MPPSFASSRTAGAWPATDAIRRPLVIAHRGARRQAPENTLAAGRLAHALGADAWELDVNLCLDGALVIMHDDTLERTTDVARRPDLAHLAPWRVSDMTWQQIQSLRAGADMRPPRTEPVPTLEESLLLTRDLDWLVNVEIKDHGHGQGDKAIVAAVLNAVRRLDMLPRVLFSSFRHDYLQRLRVLEPKALLGALVETRPPQGPAALCDVLDAVFYHPLHTALTAEDTVALHEAGKGALPWTVNDEADMDALLTAGADGLITDAPGAGLAAVARFSSRPAG